MYLIVWCSQWSMSDIPHLSQHVFNIHANPIVFLDNYFSPVIILWHHHLVIACICSDTHEIDDETYIQVCCAHVSQTVAVCQKQSQLLLGITVANYALVSLISQCQILHTTLRGPRHASTITSKSTPVYLCAYIRKKSVVMDDVQLHGWSTTCHQFHHTKRTSQRQWCTNFNYQFHKKYCRSVHSAFITYLNHWFTSLEKQNVPFHNHHATKHSTVKRNTPTPHPCGAVWWPQQYGDHIIISQTPMTYATEERDQNDGTTTLSWF